MVDLEQILRVALNNENVKTLEENSVFREYEPFWKPYWILSELESFITGRKSVDTFFDTLQHGTEVLVSLDDPWPFFGLAFPPSSKLDFTKIFEFLTLFGVMMNLLIVNFENHTK